MSKRHLAAGLWFISGWTFGAFLSFVFGLPGGLDVAFSLIAGALIWWDPARLLWSPTPALRRPAEVAPGNTFATD